MFDMYVINCAGEFGLVYKAYLSSGGETQVVAVKAGKGTHCFSIRFITTDERNSTLQWY